MTRKLLMVATALTLVATSAYLIVRTPSGLVDAQASRSSATGGPSLGGSVDGVDGFTARRSGAERSGSVPDPALQPGLPAANGSAWPEPIGDNPKIPIELRVRPGCESVGGRMTATVITEPLAYVALIVQYADGRPRSTWYTGNVGEDGRLRFRWVVHPQAPTGAGRVMVAVTDSVDEEADTVSAPFLVEVPGGCPR